MAKRFKSDYAPEEWAAYLKKLRLRRLANVDKERERLREYNARPEVKERRRLHDAKHEVTKKRREYANSKKGKQKAKLAFQALKNDPEKWKSRLDYQRLKRTSFTKELIDSLIIFQNNKCAICETIFDNPKNIKADHDHTTNKPRGLLCHKCNIIEGMICKMGFTPMEYADRLHNYLLNNPVNLLISK